MAPASRNNRHPVVMGPSCAAPARDEWGDSAPLSNGHVGLGRASEILINWQPHGQRRVAAPRSAFRRDLHHAASEGAQRIVFAHRSPMCLTRIAAMNAIADRDLRAERLEASRSAPSSRPADLRRRRADAEMFDARRSSANAMAPRSPSC